ncbi:50S ribosomal protein L4 [Chitinimonas sp. BJB300]|uniref:50S ribosomal protein L4 n=1 Tax=Chitinimonas sp. BJB300 TaxID=1559339 RepID=UPI000C0D07BF|nr:50S ribosomal protein L4 [Chitinimonas sp. BJB300]PHV10468.1 50S ribosomal protein L4 [Chitinimonas sp. BJB300]TSJ90855.1 50S ribosomal protein L4 [Chitinimonas sp. BJB300]
MELKVINASGQSAASVTASDALFGRDYNEDLVHQVVTAYLANARSGNRAQKGRSDIAKSTRKPWRQKGTGRARAGMASSPLWRGGGRIFPNSPEENFSQKVNRKMYRAGVATILSQLVREERLVVVEDFVAESPKTKAFAAKLSAMGLNERTLIVTDNLDENLYLASRNLPNVLVLEPSQADPVSLVRFKKVLVTREALKQIEEILA